MGLEAYRRRRDFERTPEPSGSGRADKAGKLEFVVQKHAARRLHYDFRLECGGALVSWAVPKGPSLDPGERRLAVQTEDHPIEYADFEGVIPARQYGAGAVLVWDRGYWVPEGDPERALREGKLDFSLQGEKLRGRWTLVRMPQRRDRKEDKENWLLIKRRDREARAGASAEVGDASPKSVLTGRSLEEIAAAADRIGHTESGEVTAAQPRRVGRPETVAGAQQGPLPDAPAPQLATLVERVPEETSWFHEPKLDGYRLLCRIDRGQTRLLTRRGNDWTDRFPALADAAASLPCSSAVLDGEAVALDAGGRSDFQLLQNAIGRRDPHIVMVAFDLLYLDGWDLRPAPLRARKELLRLLLAEAPGVIRYGDHVEGRGPAFFREACRAGLEGIVSKQADAPYRGQRSRSWLKVKCHRRQELVVVGFTDPGGSRAGFGALLLATRDRPGAALRYAGKVGTGFDERTLLALRQELDLLVRPDPPAQAAPAGREARGVHWVEPELVAEVTFGDWTRDGIIRHATFRGLREDVTASEVVKERAADETAAPPNGEGAGSPERRTRDRPVGVAGVALTHPGKVLYPEQGVTKLQLAHYYEQVGELALPHLRDRPLTLLRCPDGHQESCFYQKHIQPGVPDALRRVKIKEDEEPYGAVDDLSGLIALVQLGVLEIHVWGSRTGHLEAPDIIVFDLDPAEDVSWARVVEAAHQLRERLGGLGLGAFARLTGGKGLHVVVPIIPGPNWDQVKSFSRAVAQLMVREQPSQFTARMSKHRRGGKVFIDYFRNAREATAIAAYSARAKPGAPVALPIEWRELDAQKTGPPRYSILEVPKLVRGRRDPWRDLEQSRRSISELLGTRRRR